MNYLDDSRPSISVTGDKVLYADQSFLKCIALINGSRNVLLRLFCYHRHHGKRVITYVQKQFKYHLCKAGDTTKELFLQA